MRLWDLRTNGCQGLLQAPAQPCAAFDQQVPPQGSRPHLAGVPFVLGAMCCLPSGSKAR